VSYYLYAFCSSGFGIVINITKNNAYKVSTEVILECDVGSLESLARKEVFHSPDVIQYF